MIRYFFADRDGTVIVDKHYLSDPEQVELFPQVGQALKMLQDRGIHTYIVTNQSGIGRGYFTEKELFACQDRLAELLNSEGVRLADYAYCPHAPEENCACRKPMLGMWERLSAKYGLDAKECVMIGDKKEDVLFGINAGFSASCLVLTGKGEKTAKEYGIAAGASVEEFSGEVFGKKQFSTKCYTAPTVMDFVNFLLSKNGY